MIVDKNEWKEIFKEDIREKLDESYEELEKYRSTGRVVFLQQAGNKMFSVVENWMMVKYNTRVTTYGELRQLVSNNTHDRRLVSTVAQRYRNDLRGELQEFEDMYMEVYETMKTKIAR